MKRNKNTVLGIDAGGTKVCIGLVSDDGQVISSLRFPQRYCPIEVWAEELADKIDGLLADNEIAAIGIGSRGYIDYNAQLFLATTIMDVTPGFDLCAWLHGRYGCPVFMDNDVKAVACAELLFGAGRESRNFICYNIGTGIAAAVVADGRLLRGEHNNAGEIGYDIIPRPDCNLEDSGLEAAASGRGIESEAAARVRAWGDSLLDSKEEITARDVLEACRRGDRPAAEVVDRAVLMLAVSIVNIEHLLDPERFIFVGGVVSDRWFFDRLVKQVKAISEGTGKDWTAKLQISLFGTEYAGLLGAASVAFYRMTQ